MVAYGLTERRAAADNPRPRRSPGRAPDASLAAASRAGARAPTTRRVTPARRAADWQAVFTVDGEEIELGLRRLPGIGSCWIGCERSAGGMNACCVTLRAGFDGERITIPIPDQRGAPQGVLRLRIDASQRPKVLAMPGTRLALIPRPAPGQEPGLAG